MKKLMVPIVALAFISTACSEEAAEPAEERVTPVETAEVVQEDLEVIQQFYGRILPETVVPVMVPAAGEVEELHVENGERVEEGEVMATVKAAGSGAVLEIEAPRDGEVAALTMDEGGLISTTDPLLTIADLDPVTVEVEITASDLHLFEGEEEAIVAVDDADFEEEAPLTSIGSIPGENGLYTIELEVENEEKEMKPGMSAVVSTVEEVVADTLLVPTAALVEETDRAYVYLIEEEEAVQVPVTVTEVQSDWAAIDGELEEGDAVVVKGQLTLMDGSPVRVEKEEEQP